MVDNAIINTEVIRSKIYTIRGMQIMLDTDLAELYYVKVKRLNQQVNRNIERFPKEFMFQLTKEEANNWLFESKNISSRSQIATLKKGENIKYLLYAFTEQEQHFIKYISNKENAKT